MRKLVLRTLAGLMMFCFVCTPALAQTTGTIRGQIKDRDGTPPWGCFFLEIAPVQADQQPGRVRQTAGLFRFAQIFDLFLGCAVIPAYKAQRSDNTYDSENPVQ
jgi:hypothetical protein